MASGGDTVQKDLLSGLTLWPNSGFRFRVPGLNGLEAGAANAVLAGRVRGTVTARWMRGSQSPRGSSRWSNSWTGRRSSPSSNPAAGWILRRRFHQRGTQH